MSNRFYKAAAVLFCGILVLPLFQRITRLLPEAVGEQLAAELMFAGEMVKGARFERCPGVNHVLPRAEVMPRALALARRIAEKPRFALELLKRHLSTGRRQRFEEARVSEAAMHQVCFARPETAERIREAYVRPEPGSR